MSGVGWVFRFSLVGFLSFFLSFPLLQLLARTAKDEEAGVQTETVAGNGVAVEEAAAVEASAATEVAAEASETEVASVEEAPVVAASRTVAASVVAVVAEAASE